MQLGRPVWVDYPHFNLEYHIRQTAIPSPGGEDALRRLVGRVMSQPLDRSKPLWEQWLVEGLEGDRWALISKTHHAMVDGVSGADMLAVVLDIVPDGAVAETSPWVPGPQPTPARLALDAVGGMIASPFEQARLVRAATRVPRRAWRDVSQVARSMWSAAGVVRGPSPPTSLNGPLGAYRRWTTAATSVEEVKAVRQGLGGTFNDVVLAAITKGFRELLLARGEDVDRIIRTLVPVSVRPRNERGTAVGDGTYNNQVSGMFAQLPLGIADPVERLNAISVQMEGIKESKHAMAGEALTSLSGFAPPVLLAVAGRLASRMSQRTVNTVTTNVPGPQLPLYSAGRRMLRAYPYVPLGAQMRLGVAIFSYDGKVTFGMTADYDSAPDVQVLADGIEGGMRELLAAAGAAGSPREEHISLEEPRAPAEVPAPAP
jgi:WS/DGAT/MGAT family acyltransferase